MSVERTMNRRGVFKTILSAVGAGVFLNVAESIAAEAPTRYGIIATQCKDVVAFGAEYHALTRNKLDGTPCRYVVEKKLDTLLLFMLGEFRSQATLEEVRAVLRGKFDISGLTEDKLVQLSDGVVPMAVLRELMVRHHIIFDARNITAWVPFSERFQDLIMSA